VVLDALLQTLDEAVLVFDEGLSCRAAGGRVAALLGLPPSSLVGSSRASLLDKLGASAPVAASIFTSLRNLGLSPERVSIDPLELPGPPARTFVWTSAPIVHEGAVVGRIDVVRDLTRQREVESATAAMARKLDEMSLVDALTGLPNRRRFQEECEREHTRAQRVWDSYAIARVDVDGMAAVNASFGREKGDRLLRLLGDALRSSRRQYDVVARWDNDDFMVLLPCVDPAAAKTVLARAATGLVAAAREAGFAITVSAGVAVWTPPSAESAADVLTRAAAALDAAKRAGPGAIRVDATTKAIQDVPE
jgi:diguanylate cyclase (GGDEF)-like protein